MYTYHLQRGSVMSDKLQIKKYENRRLYNTEKSAYVTLDDISQIIKQGRAVEVIDVKTKEDVTAFILTQIILEQAKKSSLLPVALLHIIIRFGDNILSDFFDNYLQQVINNYLSYRALVDDQFRKWLNMGKDVSNVAASSFTDVLPFKPFFDLFNDAKTTGETKS